MADLDIRKLRVLRELDERGTVAATAAALHVTPSAVSQQIFALSKETGVRLIEPVGRRVRLTDAARVLLRRANEIFAQLEQARADLAAFAAGSLAEVRVAGFAATLSGLVLPAVRALRDSHPDLTVRLAEADPPESFDQLMRGDVDIVLSLESQDSPAATDRRFHRVALLAERFDVALPVHHRLAQAPVVRLADLAEESWIFANTGTCRDISLAACTAAGFTPATSHTIGDWDATLGAVELGLGLALVPRLIGAGPRHDVVIRALDAEQPTRHVFAAVRQGSQHAAHLAAVLDALAEVAAAKAGPHEVPANRVVELKDRGRKTSMDLSGRAV
jgi:DNA-binding transcriptional LysR family regulator